MSIYQRMKNYVKDKWDYVAVGATAGAAAVSMLFAVDSYKTNNTLEREIEREKAKQERKVDIQEMEKMLKRLEKKYWDIGLKRDEILEMITSIEDYSQPKVRIAGFVQEAEDWSILPRPENCSERKGRLYFQLSERDIIGKTENGDYLIEFKQDGPEFDLIGIKIGESGWHYGRPGKAMQVKMSGEDFNRHVQGKDVEIQVMGLNELLKESIPGKDYLVMSSYKGII